MELTKTTEHLTNNFQDFSMNEKLHEWEKLENCSAPLSTFQRNSCLDLGDEVIPRLFPKTLIDDTTNTSIRKSSDKAPIETVHDFLEYFTDINFGWLESENEKYNLYLNELIEKRDKCLDIQQKIEEAILELDLLNSEYKKIACKTNPLYTVSEKLSAEEANLRNVLNNVNNNLCMFKTIESVLKRLESSVIAVTSNEFLRILDDIDNCCAYFKEHETYKESGIYLLKSRHCLSKALSDVKSYIMSVLDTCKTIQTNISLLPASSIEGINFDVAKSNKYITQYGRFETIASRLKPLLVQLENRSSISYEYECTLEECIKYYVGLRNQIISFSLKESVSQLVQNKVGDYCSLLRSVATTLIYASKDEDKLYYQFFSKSSKIFTDFVESLCSILYDTIRPMVIHIKHMETLAEFCSILRVEILQDHVQNHRNLEPFGNIAEQLLKDVQERLVFRAHLYFRTDILQFSPSPGDLAYPEKLEMMKDIAAEIKAQEEITIDRFDTKQSVKIVDSSLDKIQSNNSVSRSISQSCPADLHGMWYPPIRRTIVCLSRLYRCVEKTVFQGLAQEAIAFCCENVNEGAKNIEKTKGVLDGQLFHIKHLLILREQISPFQVDFTVTEMSLDFNHLKSAAYELLQKRKLFTLNSNNVILEFLLHGSPLLRENYLDSRKIVDKQLKNTCEEFISYSTNIVISPMNEFMLQVKEYKKTNRSNSSLKESSFGKPEIVQNMLTECMKKVKSFMPMLHNKMELYLVNTDTMLILYKPIKNNIINCFSEMHTVINENYITDDQLLIGCPTPEQISVLLSSTVLSKKNSCTSITKNVDLQK